MHDLVEENSTIRMNFCTVYNVWYLVMFLILFNVFIIFAVCQILIL